MLKKPTILSLFLLAFCSVESFAQPYQISPRVGDVIDQNERDYFYLFPTVTGFISAKAYLHDQRKVDIIITRRQDGSDTQITYTISRLLADHLATLIEGFESVRQKKATVNWELLGSLAWNGPALESKITEWYGVKIITRNGERLEGSLLWADDSLVILWHSSDHFNWRVTEQSTTIIRYFDIESISIERDAKFWTGFGIGGLIGAIGTGVFAAILSNALGGTVDAGTALGFGITGAAGVGLLGGLVGAILSNDIHMHLHGNPDKYYNEALPVLRDKEMFPNYLPPELLRLIHALPPRTAEDLQKSLSSDSLPPFEETPIRHILYAEGAFGPSSLCFSFNYEHPLSRSFWLRAGLGFGRGVPDEYYSTPGNGWGPMVMALVHTQGTSKLEFGLGFSLILAAKQRNSYYGSNITPGWDNVWGLHPAITLGYRYQPDEGGLLFRLGAGYTYFNGYPFELSLGYAF